MTEPAFLLDANSLIYLAADYSAALSRRVIDSGAGRVVTSSIAFAEFARGVDWDGPSAGIAERFARSFPVLPFDEAAARAYASLPFRRNSFDRLIAAHSIALDLTLITANLKDFADVPGLKLEDWTR